jgi:hypothetical protein
VYTVTFDTPNGAAVGEPQILNLFEAGMKFAGVLSQVAVTPLSNLSFDAQPQVRWALSESPDGPAGRRS